MNAFDYSILSFFSGCIGQHPRFDHALINLSNSTLITICPVVAMCWWKWFKDGPETNDMNIGTRQSILSMLLVCFAALLLSRLIVKVFPFRVRPLCDPTSGLHFPAGTTDWQNWSSFPSDHAIMFFTLTVGLFSISRLLGWIALVDTVFLICLPRVYLGIHYPTDVLGGAVIGVAAGFIARNMTIGRCLAKWPLQWLERNPGLFYAVFFVFMYQMVVMFWDVRLLGSGLARILERLPR